MKPMNQFTDEQLVQCYQSGDNQAFELLLMRHKSKVYSYIYSVVRNRELSEDIFQETFTKAVITLQQGRYVDSGKFYSWLCRIAHNLIIDHFRRKKNENTYLLEDADYDLLNDALLSEKSIEDVMSNEQVMVDVVKLIDYLPLLQQEVVRMRYFENLGFKEIAEKTNVSINTALGRMRYALMNIRRIADEKNVYLEIK
jgi:RNA polymerase sigma-70 factor (ECF subfamily)